MLNSWQVVIYFEKTFLSVSYFFSKEKEIPKGENAKGPFKYYVIMFLTFLGPPTHLFDDLQCCKSSKIAIFWPHTPTLLMT